MISLDCEKDVFPDAITSAGIILYDSSRIYSNVEFRSVASLDTLQFALEGEPVANIPYDELDPASKWLPYFDQDAVIPDQALTVPLDHYGRFTRGIATGANEFFVLKPSHAAQLGLTTPEVSPCVTKSVQIRTPFFTDSDYDDLLGKNEPVLLFTAGASHSERAGGRIHPIRRRSKDTTNASSPRTGPLGTRPKRAARPRCCWESFPGAGTR